MIAGEALAARLVGAAKQSDWKAIHGLLDWRLGRARAFAVALAQLDPGEREEMAQRGIADLAATEARAEDAMGVLGKLVRELSYPTRIRAPTDAERARALAELQVPAAPSHVSAGIEAELAELRAGAAAIRDVVVIDSEGPRPRSFLFAVPAGAARLVHLEPETP